MIDAYFKGIAFSLVISLLLLCYPATAEDEVTFSAVGDVLLDRGIRNWIRREGLNYPFANVAEYIRGRDIAFCNLECQVSSHGEPLEKLYTFRGDINYLDAVGAAGFDILSLANNHSLDFGRDALLDTIYEINVRGMRPAGAGKNRLQASIPAFIKKKGIRFAFIASNQIVTVGIQADPRKPSSWDAPVDEIIRIVKLVRPFVEYVVVSLHWGVEFSAKPGKKQVGDAHKIIDAGADIVIGHHPHTIQAIEIYKNCIILYSLGNFLFDQHEPPGNVGMIFECAFTREGIKEAALIPVLTQRCRPGFLAEEESRAVLEGLKVISSGSYSKGVFKEGKIILPEFRNAMLMMDKKSSKSKK